ncbi:hypothetical protein [Kitasatospora cheerisanensis]|uniref:Uncharacterized protein n=1 Tax=Kitasatospora cheerisanensis KCTC 2395 TaxID=1348663 RepID=A0A066YZT5_9ACTN|nr:hypothetical protein [Kitasatospora cheerisanensis]KDN87053.1 hypothetical protein KCH_11380 [Kitasatospora cheerisanensis KCTC 2395]
MLGVGFGFGFGALPAVALPAEFSDLARVTEDQGLTRLRTEYVPQNAKRYVPRSIEGAGYRQPGATGLAGAQLLAVAVNGPVPDAAQAATRLLGGWSPGGAATLADGTGVTGLRTFDPGPLSGTLASATLDVADPGLPACARADGSTRGSLTDGTETLTLDELA